MNYRDRELYREIDLLHVDRKEKFSEHRLMRIWGAPGTGYSASMEWQGKTYTVLVNGDSSTKARKKLRQLISMGVEKKALRLAVDSWRKISRNSEA